MLFLFLFFVFVCFLVLVLPSSFFLPPSSTGHLNSDNKLVTFLELDYKKQQELIKTNLKAYSKMAYKKTHIAHSEVRNAIVNVLDRYTLREFSQQVHKGTIPEGKGTQVEQVLRAGLG